LAEAPSFGKPILLYDDLSVGAKSYLAVARELLWRIESPAADGTSASPAVAPAEMDTAPPAAVDELSDAISDHDPDPLPEVTT